MARIKGKTRVQRIVELLQDLLDKKIESFTLEDVAKEVYDIFDIYVQRSYEVHLCHAKKKFPERTFKKEKYTGLITLSKNE